MIDKIQLSAGTAAFISCRGRLCVIFVMFILQIELDKNITILKDKNQELEKAIERMSEQQPINVDEAVTTTTPLYKQ